MLEEVMESRCELYEVEIAQLKDAIKAMQETHEEQIKALKEEYAERLFDKQMALNQAEFYLEEAKHKNDIYEGQLEIVKMMCGHQEREVM